MEGTLLSPNDAEYFRLNSSDTGKEEVSIRLCLISLAHVGFLCSRGFGTPYVCLSSLHRYLKDSQ